MQQQMQSTIALQQHMTTALMEKMQATCLGPAAAPLPMVAAPHLLAASPAREDTGNSKKKVADLVKSGSMDPGEWLGACKNLAPRPL